jgi:hypothetical protein
MRHARRWGLRLAVLGLISACGATTAATAWAGDPVPGVDVTLEQVPGGIVLKSEKGVLEPGGPIGAFSENLIFETAAGNFECEESRLEGTVLSNSQKAKDNASMTKASLKGDFDGIPGACKTSATGPVLTETSGFPWLIEFTKKGTGKLKGTKKITFTTTFLALEPPNNKCTFEAATVKFSFPVNAPWQLLTPTITKQTFKHNKKAANQTPICPASGVMSGSFVVDDPR